jgi:hypothetical protein
VLITFICWPGFIATPYIVVSQLYYTPRGAPGWVKVFILLSGCFRILSMIALREMLRWGAVGLVVLYLANFVFMGVRWGHLGFGQEWLAYSIAWFVIEGGIVCFYFRAMRWR